MRRGSFFLFFIGVASLGRSVGAQVPDAQARVSAQDLFDHAAKLMDQAQYDAACPKLEEVVRLQPNGVGANLTLAECYEHTGRLASAWTRYVSAEAAAERASQPERQKVAHDHALALKPILSELTITVASEARVP